MQKSHYWLYISCKEYSFLPTSLRKCFPMLQRRSSPITAELKIHPSGWLSPFMFVQFHLRISTGPRLLPFHGHSSVIMAPPKIQQLVMFSSLLILSPKSTNRFFPNLGVSTSFSSCCFNFVYKSWCWIGPGLDRWTTLLSYLFLHQILGFSLDGNCKTNSSFPFWTFSSQPLTTLC